MTDYSNRNDEELISEYRATNNQQLMAILFTKYADIGFRTAVGYMRNQADAEDVLQYSYIHFVENLSLFKEGTTIRPWLMKIIVNTCKNKLLEEKRRMKRQYKIASERMIQQQPAKTNIDIDFDKTEIKELIKKNVDLLPEKYRSPIWLVLFEEISYPEVATVLSLPEKTIRTQVSRGLEKLRRLLSGYGSALSVTAISGLIKEINLEKAPNSVLNIINSPKIFSGVKDSKIAIQTKSNLNLMPGILKGLVILFLTLTLIISLPKLNSLFYSTDKKSEEVQNHSSQVLNKNPNIVSLNFNHQVGLEPYKYLGSFEYINSGGIEDSGCIEVSKSLILKIPIEKKQLPIKISFRRNFKYEKEGIIGMSYLTWDSWKKMSILDDDTPLRELTSVSGKYIFEKDEDWELCTFIVTPNYIDLKNEYGRINIYFVELNEDNKHLYLTIVDKVKIDNFTIEPMDASKLPDVTYLQDINNKMYLLSDKETTSIKSFFPQSKKSKIIHKKFNSITKTELTQMMENISLE